MQRIGDEDSGVYTHKGTSSSGDVFLFDYEAWAGNGMPMQVEVDKGGDGSVDTMQDLANDE